MENEYFMNVHTTKSVYNGRFFADIGKTSYAATPYRMNVITHDNYKMKRV